MSPDPANVDCLEEPVNLCPWTKPLVLGDFEILPESLFPKEVVHCRRQAWCSWQVREDGQDTTIISTALRRDPLPFENVIPVWPSERGRCRKRIVSQVDDGWIVATDAGEWGGSIWWLAHDGSRIRELTATNTSELIKTKLGVVALTGLDHIDVGKGKALLVSPSRNGKWRAKTLAALGATAYAGTTAPDGSLLVVTRTQLVRLSLGGKVTVLHTGRWNAFFPAGGGAWMAFDPSSVVTRPNGEILIGIQAAVVRLVPQEHGYREEWLVPAKCIDIAASTPSKPATESR